MSNQLLLRRRAMMLGKKNEDNILTFTAETANSSVQLTAVGAPSAVTLEYNLNGGGWLPYTIGDTISLPNVGDNVKMRGNNATFSTSISDNYYKFVITGYIAASGDVTSLLNGIGGDVVVPQYCYCYLFYSCTGLTQAPALPATTLAERCYDTMFSGCTGLTQAPALPATTLAEGCYVSMFSRCTGLTQAPALPATTLAESCYSSMFLRCTKITSHDVATLNNSSQVFYNNSSCTSFIIHAETPPTIGSKTITGLKADCKIYVPYSEDHSILDAYKAAQYWSARAGYMYELDENGEIPE